MTTRTARTKPVARKSRARRYVERHVLAKGEHIKCETRETNVVLMPQALRFAFCAAIAFGVLYAGLGYIVPFVRDLVHVNIALFVWLAGLLTLAYGAVTLAWAYFLLTHEDTYFVTTRHVLLLHGITKRHVRALDLAGIEFQSLDEPGLIAKALRLDYGNLDLFMAAEEEGQVIPRVRHIEQFRRAIEDEQMRYEQRLRGYSYHGESDDAEYTDTEYTERGDDTRADDGDDDAFPYADEPPRRDRRGVRHHER